MNLKDLINAYLCSFRIYEVVKNKGHWINVMGYWKMRIDENLRGGL